MTRSSQQPVRPTRNRSNARVLPALASASILLGCATTVDDTTAADQPAATEDRQATDDATGTIDPEIDEPAPAPTAPIIGTASELLPKMATEMGQLGSRIAEGSDDVAALDRIEAIWTAIRPELESARPDLVNGIGSTVDMARIAVERTRPADADKAFSILIDLVDRFTEDP